MAQDFSLLRQRMRATGISLARLEGAWWLPAAEPFVLPAQAAADLAAIGRAIFVLFDVVTNLYGTSAGAKGGLDALLNYKVPPAIPRLMSQGRVDSVRPDFQLILPPEHLSQSQAAIPDTHHAPRNTPLASSPPRLTPHAPRFIATELEICPSAHGYAHAMQVGYGLPADLAAGFARYLQGRELLFVGAEQWSEFLFEQLAFCRALAEVGGRGRVLYDVPIATMAAEVNQGRRWQSPEFGIKEKPAAWHFDDVLARIGDYGFEPFVYPDAAGWPDEVGQAVVFRFGYFDCFSPEKLRRFIRWQAKGATLLNPAMFILDSKTILAALNLPVVREQIAAAQPDALAVLDSSIPETRLLQPETVAAIVDQKDDWLIKYAGFDGDNQAWGGRSLRVGRHCSAESWRTILTEALALPWPVVAQRLVPSAQIDLAYLDAANEVRLMRQGTTRLRVFFLRRRAETIVCGPHLTVSGGTMQVSEATDAIQAPVVFRD
ncbi:MAG: hypothetical protein Fur0044_20020 [Anaerolineae bacterium]|nr:hypothetical protein [Anaerolineales bacterium]MCQ3978773.1 hypothetical protein [Anaerolineae bacterium]